MRAVQPPSCWNVSGRGCWLVSVRPADPAFVTRDVLPDAKPLHFLPALRFSTPSFSPNQPTPHDPKTTLSSATKEPLPPPLRQNTNPRRIDTPSQSNRTLRQPSDQPSRLPIRIHSRIGPTTTRRPPLPHRSFEKTNTLASRSNGAHEITKIES